jgi:acetyl esterase/lipase
MKQRPDEGELEPGTKEQAFPVKLMADLVYATPDGSPQRLDLYQPQGVERPLPVILWLYGGGSRFGDRKLGPDLSRYFAQRGFAMVSIDYRLSGEAIFPAQIHDVKTAIRWVRTYSDRYGLDGQHIGLWGSSAGGHLAVLAAMTGSDILEGDQVEYAGQSSEVQAVVDGYGPTDFLQQDAHRNPLGRPSDDPESIQLPPGKLSSDPDSLESLLLGAPIKTRPDLVRQANPLTYVKASTPPFLLLHGLSDTAVPAHQSVLLYEALAAAGNHVTLCLIKGLGHGFLNRNDFDKGPPRPVTVRRTRHGGPEQVKDGPPVTFDTIDAFFQEHLCVQTP